MTDVPTTRLALIGTGGTGTGGQIPDNATGLVTPQNVRNLAVTMLGPPVTLVPAGGAVTWPLATAPIASVILTANTAITVTGGENGMIGYALVIIQGGAGSFVPTLTGVTLSSTPVWNTAPNSFNRIYIHAVLVNAAVVLAADWA